MIVYIIVSMLLYVIVILGINQVLPMRTPYRHHHQQRRHSHRRPSTTTDPNHKKIRRGHDGFAVREAKEDSPSISNPMMNYGVRRPFRRSARHYRHHHHNHRDRLPSTFRNNLRVTIPNNAADDDSVMIAYSMPRIDEMVEPAPDDDDDDDNNGGEDGDDGGPNNVQTIRLRKSLLSIDNYDHECDETGDGDGDGFDECRRERQMMIGGANGFVLGSSNFDAKFRALQRENMLRNQKRRRRRGCTDCLPVLKNS